MLSVLWLVCSAVYLYNLRALASQVVLEATSARDATDDRQGAVASESKICSQIGIDLMSAGGNAADAVGKYPLVRESSDLHSARSLGRPFASVSLVSRA